METDNLQPARVRLARELAGLTQAEVASRSGVTAAAISQYEGGVSRPTQDVAERLAAALSVPPRFLTLPVVDTHDGFFRSLRRTSVTQRRRARAIAHVAHDLAVQAPGALPAVRIPVRTLSPMSGDSEEIEATASAVRQTWDIGPGPVPDVVASLEANGVLVIRLPLETGDVDAFSLPFSDRPVVVLGADKNDRARSRFDAAHELGHLVIHGDTVWGTKEVEQQAHSFAAAFLMPANEIYDDLPSTVDWPRLFDLKRHWQVSLAALLMRARTLRKMTPETYLTAVKAASARGWRRVEPVPLGTPEQPHLLSSLIAGPKAKTVMLSLPADVIASLASATA